MDLGLGGLLTFGLKHGRRQALRRRLRLSRRRRSHSAFSSRGFGFFRSELVSTALTMGGSSAFAPRLAGFLGGKFMRSPFPMSCDSAFAGDFSFGGFIHRGESASFFFCHDYASPLVVSSN